MNTTQRPLYEIKADLFKGLAHPVRIRALELLAVAEEMSVTELLMRTGLEASHLSQHLSVLRRQQLVTSERRSSTVFYRLAFPEVADLLRVSRLLLGEVLQVSAQQLSELQELPDDFEAIRR